MSPSWKYTSASVMCLLSAHCPDPAFSDYHSLIKGSRVLGEIAQAKTGQEKHIMNLENLVMPESEDLFKHQKAGDTKGHRLQPERPLNSQS